MKKTQRDMTGETRLAEAFAADALDHALKVIHDHNWDRPRMVR